MVRAGLRTVGLEAIDSCLMDRYLFDAAGRLQSDRGGEPAPRFVFARAADGCLWRFRSDLPKALVASVSRLAGREAGWGRGGEEAPLVPERLVMMARLLGVEGAPSPYTYQQIVLDGEPIGEVWTFA